ncbi:hypothetical protein JL49_13495 [Pseudoalteromonas luteoviolacea]|nr:hypothetical protein JL49_13495 [Pseudoalteromonas luteoviolacea]
MEGITPICGYCGRFSKKVSGREIYPHRPDLFKKTFYTCQNCDAYVGCHKGTDKPMGRLANAQLRTEKSNAHRTFDQLWRNGHMKRQDAYKWLAKKLGVNGKDCHIGMFDVETCKKVVRISLNHLSTLKAGVKHG